MDTTRMQACLLDQLFERQVVCAAVGLAAFVIHRSLVSAILSFRGIDPLVWAHHPCLNYLGQIHLQLTEVSAQKVECLARKASLQIMRTYDVPTLRDT